MRGRAVKALAAPQPSEIEHTATNHGNHAHAQAHIDHGKSTLSDRLMAATGAVAAGARAQYLDRLQARLPLCSCLGGGLEG